jgi:hypothetical protein
MQTANDLRKLVAIDTVSKDDITDMIRKVGALPLPAPQRQAALGALSDAYISVSKGDESGALGHVKRARAALAKGRLA